jgi:hypothetical protein
MNADVFISYSSVDKKTAEELCSILESHDIRCWIAPRDVPLGDSWPLSILRAIAQSNAFLLLLTPEANASGHVVNEVNLAVSNRKPIFVLRAADIRPIDELQYFLANRQWTDGFPPPLDARVGQMAESLQLLLGKKQLKRSPDQAPPAAQASSNLPQVGERTCLPPSARRQPLVLPVAPPTQVPPQRVHPQVPPPKPVVSASLPVAKSAVFDERGRIQSAAFAFALDGMLLRAARRRNDQQRARASVADFLAGLLRAGGLTRLVLQRGGRDPDALYAQLREVPEPTTPLDQVAEPGSGALNDGSVPDAALLQAMLSRWILRHLDDFTPELAALLEGAARAEDGRVTEQAIIESMIETPEWTSAGIALPSPADVKNALEILSHSHAIDANGAVPLDFLAPAAREIVQHAHLLSQQCQSASITHRLFLAAFVASDTGFASRVCRRAGVDTELLQGLLVTISAESEQEGAGKTPNVILSPDVCARIVSPTLAQARREARNPDQVSEGELFRAFCHTADPAFGEFLKSRSALEDLEPIEADLRELMAIDPDRSDRLDGLTLRARDVVRRAHRLALERGVRVIPNRLMLAAFLEHDDAHARLRLQDRNISAQKLHDWMMASTPACAAAGFDLDDEACARIVTPVIERARILAKQSGFVTESILFRAFCEVADSAFKAALLNAGIDVNALSGGRPDLRNPGAWGPN